MWARIHHGTTEIGGTCIEIEAQDSGIVHDVGLPSDAPVERHEVLLPEVRGFTDRDESLLAVAVSHPHQDHYGPIRCMRPEVPASIGRGRHTIMKAARA